jgi:hypothetical protein
MPSSQATPTSMQMATVKLTMKIHLLRTRCSLLITLQGGLETGDATDEKGNAFITIPGGVDYPVTLRMEPPKDSNLKLIGPTSVNYPSDTPAKFLFSK